MSTEQMDGLRFVCPLEDPEQPGLRGHDKFVRAYVTAQVGAAEEEIGDAFNTSPWVVDKCQREAGTDLPTELAGKVAGAVIRCMTARFMGNCSRVTASCTGSENMEQHLATAQTPDLVNG